MSYEIADILDAAADVIERDGWIQHAFQRGERRCAVGALCAAAGVSAAFELPKPLLATLKWAAGLTKGQEVALWNDAPERTEQEVLDALRLAAKRERIAEDGAA